MKLRIKTDGGCRESGCACAAVAYTDASPYPIAQKSKYLGRVTSHAAEHHGILLAMELGLELKASSLIIETDSAGVADSFAHDKTVKGSFLEQQRKLAKKFKSVKVNWVGRANVFPAHTLATSAIALGSQREKWGDTQGIGRDRIFADTKKFLTDNNIFVKQFTEFCFHTVKGAVVPIWDYTYDGTYVYPLVSPQYEKDIFTLDDHVPVILFWRPYGIYKAPYDKNRIPFYRPLKSDSDGGVELMAAEADRFDSGELVSTTNRFFKMRPARDLIWWLHD